MLSLRAGLRSEVTGSSVWSARAMHRDRQVPYEDSREARGSARMFE